MRDGIARVTLNRREVGNALTPAQRELLVEWIREFSEVDEIRCVVLAATGRFFAVARKD